MAANRVKVISCVRLLFTSQAYCLLDNCQTPTVKREALEAIYLYLVCETNFIRGSMSTLPCFRFYCTAGQISSADNAGVVAQPRCQDR